MIVNAICFAVGWLFGFIICAVLSSSKGDAGDE